MKYRELKISRHADRMEAIGKTIAHLSYIEFNGKPHVIVRFEDDTQFALEAYDVADPADSKDLDAS